jgi:hypothetical protein
VLNKFDVRRYGVVGHRNDVSAFVFKDLSVRAERLCYASRLRWWVDDIALADDVQTANDVRRL